MSTTTHTPVVIGQGQAVHIAGGEAGTLCRPSAFAVEVADTYEVDCKRCLAKAEKAAPAPAAPAPADRSTIEVDEMVGMLSERGQYRPDMEVEEMLAILFDGAPADADEAAPATETPAAAPVATESKGKGKKTPAACACGCELPTGGRYRPGHDARHSGWLARQVIAGELTYDEAMDRLATDALRAKTHRQIERAAAKAAPAA